MTPRVQTGLDHFITGKIGDLKSASLGVCCHPASVNQQIRGLPQLLQEQGYPVNRWFAPEHGLLGQLQDME
ncbi:MAG: hypothetical protein ACPG1Z_07410, partial [Planctomycetota bacterium]